MPSAGATASSRRTRRLELKHLGVASPHGVRRLARDRARLHRFDAETGKPPRPLILEWRRPPRSRPRSAGQTANEGSEEKNTGRKGERTKEGTVTEPRRARRGCRQSLGKTAEAIGSVCLNRGTRQAVASTVRPPGRRLANARPRGKHARSICNGGSAPGSCIPGECLGKPGCGKERGTTRTRIASSSSATPRPGQQAGPPLARPYADGIRRAEHGGIGWHAAMPGRRVA